MAISKEEFDSAMLYYRVKQLIADSQYYMQKGSSADVIAALGYTPADSATVGGSQVTLSTEPSTVEGAIWLDFS